MEEEKIQKTTVSITLDSDVKQEAKKILQSKDMNLSSYVNSYLKKLVENEKKKQK